MNEKRYRVRTQDRVDGTGLFLVAPARAGEILVELGDEPLSAPTRTSIQVGDRVHWDGPEIGLLNHSCDPNAFIDTEERCVRALRDCKADEEITFNYLTTEAELSNPFDCTCGSVSCYGSIRGIRQLQGAQIEQLTPHLAPHMLTLLAAELV